jgi:hypothetical protein
MHGCLCEEALQQPWLMIVPAGFLCVWQHLGLATRAVDLLTLVLERLSMLNFIL